MAAPTCQVVLLLYSLGLFAGHIVILLMDHTTRFCGNHLFELLIVSMVLTMFMIGFVLLFMLMEYVPGVVKLAFHLFGFISLIFGLLLFGLVMQAEDCKAFTKELYFWSLAIGALMIATTVYFVIIIPFWIINRVWRNSVLDWTNRAGICYEPVKCCPCIWHI